MKAPVTHILRGIGKKSFQKKCDFSTQVFHGEFTSIPLHIPPTELQKIGSKYWFLT